MPLYMCSKCGSVENTALGGYWRQQMEAYEAGKKLEALCSACDPEIGAWHGEFPRRIAAGYVQTRQDHLYTVAESTGSARHMGPFRPVELPAGVPFFIRQTDQPKAVEEQRAWLDQQIAEGLAAGVTFSRFSHHPDHPEIILFEGWKERPDDQGNLRFSAPIKNWPTSSYASADKGVVLNPSPTGLPSGWSGWDDHG